MKITPLLVVSLVAAACLAPVVVRGQAPQRDPQLDMAIVLVKNAVTAVNHGNITGNYTVLRDLGGPVFRERNSAAQLATIFQRLREQKVDLSPILLVDPQFTEPPVINEAGLLFLTGFFPTQPLPVRFRLAFQRVNGGWVIDTVSIGTGSGQAPPPVVGNVTPPMGPMANPGSVMPVNYPGR